MAAGKKFDPKNVEVVRPLVLPVLKYEEETPILVKIETKMVKSTMTQDRKPADGKGEKKEKMEPATICQVTNLETGERQTLVCNAVLVSTLDEQYPDDDYIGRGFRIVKHAKAKGKRYHTFSIDEIKV